LAKAKEKEPKELIFQNFEGNNECFKTYQKKINGNYENANIKDSFLLLLGSLFQGSILVLVI